MFIDGLTDWEKRRLALILKERGFTAFMVIKHATAAISSAKRGHTVNPVDQQHLDILDGLIRELYGYERLNNEMKYSEPEEVYNAENK